MQVGSGDGIIGEKDQGAGCRAASEGKVLRIMSAMICSHVSALKTSLHECKSRMETEHLSEERLNSAVYATLCKIIML